MFIQASTTGLVSLDKILQFTLLFVQETEKLNVYIQEFSLFWRKKWSKNQGVACNRVSYLETLAL